MTIAIDQTFTDTMLTGSLALDLVHENGAYSTWNIIEYTSHLGVYSPTPGREFAELKTFPSGKSAYTLANTDEYVGLFQVILKYPADEGAFAVKTKAEDVLALFPIGGVLSYDSQQVSIVSASRDGGRNDGGFYQIVIRINYRAFVAR